MCNKNCYVGLHNHSYNSLLDGLPSPLKIVQRAKEIGSPAIAITDHGNISAMIEFHKACKKYDIKPIQGIELYICKYDPSIKTNENKHHNHLTILAKNQDGIKDLMSLVSATNRPEWFYRRPRIDLVNLSNFTQNRNLLCLSGCLVGELSESLFTDFKTGCLFGADLSRLEDCRKLLKSNWKDISLEIIEKYIKIFGKENYFLEIQSEGMVIQDIVVECLRECAKALDIKSASTLDAHYARPEDVDDHRILLYSQLRTTAEEQESIRKSGGDVMGFFYLDTFYIFTYEEMCKKYSKEEIETTLEISDMIKYDSLGHAPCLPKYHLENKTSDQYIKELCIESAKIKFKDFDKKKKQQYWERLQRELSVIEDAKLADYFLIVWDVCKFVDANNAPRGKGRGSGAGSLVNYLLNITQIDPIEYGLYWERFYNSARNLPERLSFDEFSFDDFIQK